MKVYELMNALAEMPSGADVVCAASLTVNDVESGIVIDGDRDDPLYEVLKPLDNVEKNGVHICLGF